MLTVQLMSGLKTENNKQVSSKRFIFARQLTLRKTQLLLVCAIIRKRGFSVTEIKLLTL